MKKKENEIWTNYKKAFVNALDFKGRAGRKQFWTFTLANTLFAALLSGADFSKAELLFNMIVFIPSLSLLIRRLHDVNKSAWNLLWLFFPILGFFLILYMTTLPTQAGENEYGLPEDQEKVAQIDFTFDREHNS